jgi:hypothetical protein
MLRPRPHFYGGALQLKEMLLLPVSTEAKALQLYRRGLLDVAQVPAGEYTRLATRPDFHVSASLDAYYALPDRPDEGVTLAQHLDRDELIHHASPALSPSDAIVPPAVPDYVSSPPTFDAESTTDVPRVNVRLSFPWDPAERLLRRSLYRQWRATPHGISLRLVHATSSLPDPGVWLRTALQQTNSAWYRTMLMRSARLTNDPVSRMSAYSRGENWALEKGLVIPLASGNVAYLIKARVQSLQVTPLGIMPENNSWASVSLT